MNLPPKVSVFIPNYNYASYLPKCLDSILAQTYQDFEIVIVDDGSTDNSHNLLMEYQHRFPQNIHYFWHPGHSNKGVAATSNLAMMKAQGEYLAWTGSDDVWYPEKLSLQVDQLERDPRLGMVYSYADFIGRDGKLLPGRAGLDITSDPNPLGRILQYCHPPAMTTVIRRQCLDSIGLCDETLSACEDWDLWIRLFSHWKVGFIDRPLAMYRLHGNNLSKGVDVKVDLNRILAMYRRLDEKQCDIGGALLKARNQAILNLQLAFHLFSNGEKEDAIARLGWAFERDPSLYKDTAFMSDWLSQWKPDFYTPEHSHFGFWVIAHMPSTIDPIFRNRLLSLQLKNPDTRAFFVRRGIQLSKSKPEQVELARIFEDCPHGLVPGSWKMNVLKELYATLLFESYRKGDLNNTRYYWRQAIRSDWRWLRNLGFLSIGLKAFLKSRK
jgi:glycosyltransferase involved in cell wall biosynthesis